MLYLAVRDPRVPFFAKVFTACVVAYALSPIDFIPDFIPVLGQLDDLLIVPLGIWLAFKMIPPEILTEKRLEVKKRNSTLPVGKSSIAVVVVIWSAAAVFLLAIVWLFLP